MITSERAVHSLSFVLEADVPKRAYPIAIPAFFVPVAHRKPGIVADARRVHILQGHRHIAVMDVHFLVRIVKVVRVVIVEDFFVRDLLLV